MSDLILDPEALIKAAGIIEGYCDKQREVINDFYRNIMSLRSEWVDDETFGDMMRQIDLLRSAAIDHIDAVSRTFPDEFRYRAEMISRRPTADTSPTQLDTTSDAPPTPSAALGGYSVLGGTYAPVSGTGSASPVLIPETKKKRSFSLGVLFGRTPKKDPATEYSEWLGSKPIITDLPKRDEDDKLKDGDSLFFGARGEHFAKTVNLLIKHQGDNNLNKPAYNAEGKVKSSFGSTCGLASLANIMRQLGYKDVTENDIVELATQRPAGDELCNLPSFDKKGRIIKSGGGTSNKNITDLAELLGLDSKISPNLSIEDIDETLKRGGAVMMSVVSSDLEGGSKCRKIERTDHWVTVMGVSRDRFTGKIDGILIRDTGGHNKNSDYALTLTPERFNTMRATSKDFAGVSFFRKEGA